MEAKSKELKQPYHRPQLSIYGDIKTMTLGTANPSPTNDTMMLPNKTA